MRSTSLQGAREGPGPLGLRTRGALHGRARDLEALGRIVGGGARLTTLLGPGGVGKTSLAIALVATAGRAAFVDLGSAHDEDDLARAVAAAIDRPPPEAGPNRWRAIAAMLDALGDDVLIVLDNAETVTTILAGALIVLLAWAPRARFLVTSRERLRVAPEHVVEVAPLEPARAVELFRARMERAGRPPRDDEAGAIEALVERLDGLPLAIEIAAARTRSSPPSALLARLAQGGASVLSSAMRDAEGRHATLRAVFDTSWDILDQGERVALRRVGVFASSFDLEAAAAVIGDEEAALAGLEALHDKSLVRLVDDEGPRFGMLATVRPFALERLREAGEAEATLAAHAEHFLSRGLAARRRAQSADARAGLRALASLRDELLSVVRHAEQGTIRSARSAVQALVALDPLEEDSGTQEIVLARLERAVARAECPPEILAPALTAKARALGHLGRMDEASLTIACAVEAAERAGDAGVLALALRVQAMLAFFSGDASRARAVASRALELCRRSGEAWIEAQVENTRGLIALTAGTLGEAIAQLETAARVGRASGNEAAEFFSELWLAEALVRARRTNAARRAVDLCEELCRSVPEGRLCAAAAEARALLCHAEGDFAQAASEQENVIAILALHSGDRGGIVYARRLLGAYRWTLGDRVRARALFEESARDAPSRPAAQLGRAWIAAIDVGSGDLDRARQALEDLPLPDDEAEGATDLRRALRAHVDLAIAPERALATRAGIAGDGVETSLALRLFDDAWRAVQAVVVQREGLWFQVPGGVRVQVRLRPQRRILVRLASERLAAPGHALDRDALVTAGWPDERMRATAAKNRLFAAISGLRRLGLASALTTVGDAYALALDVRFEDG